MTYVEVSKENLYLPLQVNWSSPKACSTHSGSSATYYRLARDRIGITRVCIVLRMYHPHDGPRTSTLEHPAKFAPNKHGRPLGWCAQQVS